MATPNPQLFGTHTNPYTGLSSNNALFNAPNAQNPYGTVTVNGQTNPLSQAGVITPSSPVMNSNVLTGNGTMPQMPQSAIPTMTPQSYVAGLQPLQLAPVGAGVGAQEGNRTALERRLAQAQQQLLGKGGEQLRLEGELGISQKQKEIGQLNEQFAATKAAFDSKMAGVATNTFGVESQDTRISKINRQSAIQLGGMAMVLQAKQGNLEAAKQEVDRVLALEFDPIKQDIENTKTFLELNYQDLTRADRNRADALQRDLTRQKMAIDTLENQKKLLYDYALKKNVPPELMNSIIKAQSASDIAKIDLSKFADSATPPTGSTAQFQAASFANRQEQANSVIDQLAPTLGKLSTGQFYVQLKLPNWAQSAEMQQFSQATKNYINAQLRRESGAAIADSEFKNAVAQYIPAPGDSPATLEQKRMNRLLNQNNLIAEAQDAYRPLTSALTPNASGKIDATGKDLFSSILSNLNAIYNPSTGFILPTTPPQ